MDPRMGTAFMYRKDSFLFLNIGTYDSVQTNIYQL